MFKQLQGLLIIVGILFAPVSFSAEEKQPQPSLKKAEKLWSESKFELADEQFKKALEDKPNSPQAHAEYAGFLLTQNKTEQAIKMYQKAIMLSPEDAKLFAALSIAYLHQSKYEMATAMADQALTLDPDLKIANKINEYIAKKQEMLRALENTEAKKTDNAAKIATESAPEKPTK